MKEYIKPIAYAVIILALIGIAYNYWSKPSPVTITVSQPVDSSFANTNNFDFKPASTPFEKKKTPLVRQPAGVKEKEIKREIRIIKIDSSGHADTTGIILLENGEVLVDNAARNVKSVDVANYVAPILDWGLHLQAGVSVWDHISPAIAIAPLEIEGCLQLPVLAVDIYGVGIGASYRLSHYSFGIISHYGFTLVKQIKILVTYNL